MVQHKRLVSLKVEQEVACILLNVYNADDLG